MMKHDAESTDYPYGGMILTLPFPFEEMGEDEEEVEVIEVAEDGEVQG